jgi:hypothetical protein
MMVVLLMDQGELASQRISLTYADTGEPVKPGDECFLDGHPVRINSVLIAGTTDAEDSYCDDTGGLIIESEQWGKVLIPLGALGVLTKTPLH